MAYGDFFTYDWQAPFRQAAQGDAGTGQQPLSSGRPAAAQRLTLEELLAQQDAFTPKPPPSAITDLAGLPPAARKRLQQQGLFSALAALGSSLSTGNYNNLGAGAAQIGGMEQTTIDQANQSALERWKLDQAQQAAAAQAKAGQTEASALYGAYNRIASQEPPDSPFTGQAEVAARAGDMKTLSTMMAAVPQRQAARSRGLDPDSWDTATRMQEELSAELKRRADAAEWAQNKQPQEQAKIDAETAAAVDRERQIRGLPPAPMKLEPLDYVEAKAAAEARGRQPYEKDSTTRIGQLNDGTWAEIRHSKDGTPASVTVIPGQPVKSGKLVYYKNANGEQMVYNPEMPEKGAVPLSEHQAGEKGAPSVQDLRAPRPAPPTAPAPAAAGPSPAATPKLPPAAVQEVSKATTAVVGGLMRGSNPLEALARLRRWYPDGVSGYTPEQILSDAMARARQSGWRGTE
jgi:hypothetical protein